MKVSRKILKRFVAAVLCFSIISAIFTLVPRENSSLTAWAANDATVQKYEDQLKALEEQRKELESLISSAQTDASNAAQEKSYLDSLIYTTETKIQTAQLLIEELSTQVEASKLAIEETEKLIEETEKNFMERMRMAHEDGNASYIGIILGSENVADLLSKVEQVNAMLEYDKKLKKDFQTQKEELENQKTRLEESVKLQEETLAQLEADKAETEKLAAQAETYYQNVLDDIQSNKSELDSVKEAEKKLDKELEDYLKNLSAQNSSPITATGEYIRPVNGGWISCYYGDKDPKNDPHYAYDIAVGYGTPIMATNDGSVLKAEWHWSYGYYILIDHGNGISSLYAHCSSLYVSAGQTVKRGQHIGGVGSTGYSFGNHLHFEIRKNGTRVNPANYVKF